VSTVVSAVAQYALFVVALGALLVWVRVPSRQEKVALAVEAVLAMLLVAVLVKVAGAVHTDPRPFVVDPHLRPLFPHPPDNGFPSDHTALATAVAAVVCVHRRWAGLVLLAVAVCLGAARVLAHVHHTQDIVAGVLIGLLAAAVAVLGYRTLAQRRVDRWVESRPWQLTSRGAGKDS